MLKNIKMYLIAVVLILFLPFLLFTVVAHAEEKPTKYIVVGDSRTVGMDNTCRLSEEGVFVIAKVGEGCDYLDTVVIPKIDSLIEEDAGAHSFVVISLFGINDLGNIQRYQKTYRDLMNKVDLRLVSVNPAQKFTAGQIEQFNAGLQSITAKFIDTYTVLTANGWNSVDGLHYTAGTYKTIWNIIKNSTNTLQTETITVTG